METKVIKIRNINIGGNNPVIIQTMWKERLSLADLEGAAERIDALSEMGCSILRFAVPDIESAEVLGRLAQMTAMPLVADIHFDYKIALRCMDFPIAKIRINPGNIGSKEKTAQVLEKAAAGKIPIRIGVNAGSLPKDIQARLDERKPDFTAANALVEAAQREIAVFEEFGFHDYLVSMKACGIADTINANYFLSGLTSAPLHVGVTEAGPLASGVARNTAALLSLLTKGIGDTVRVSLSDTMENEVIAAREILQAAAALAPSNARLKCNGVNIISCPRCGRHSFDTHGFTDRMLSKLYAMKKNITVAIMGCEVNGPVEAKHADLGITGAGDKVLIFKHGKIIKTISPQQADAVFEEELNSL